MAESRNMFNIYIIQQRCGYVTLHDTRDTVGGSVGMMSRSILVCEVLRGLPTFCTGQLAAF